MRARTTSLISIRKTCREDRDELAHILEETGVFTREEIDTAMELIDFATTDANQQDYTIYTGVDKTESIVGYYCIGATPLTHGTYDLYWIAVKPTFHGSGIGKQLLRHAEEWVSSHSGRLIVAETSSQPKYESTRMFYIKNKYREVARISNYYTVGDDLVIYGKYVSQSGV
jgi:ribosomal protein S18 acetylase RimI-like enzyme